MKFFLILYLVLSAFSVFGQTHQIWADSNHVEIGNAYVVHLKVESEDKPPSQVFAQWQSAIGSGQILAQEPWVRVGKYWEGSIQLIFFDSARFVLPQLHVLGGVTDSLVVVSAPMQVADTTAIAPLRSVIFTPEPPSTSTMTWLMGILALLVLLLLLYYVWKRSRKTSHISSGAQGTPLATWAERCDKLAATIPLEPQSKFYEELSYLLRVWLNERYHIATLERTTSEIMQDVAQFKELESQHGAILKILHRSDLVKFAKEYPALDQQKEIWNLFVACCKR